MRPEEETQKIEPGHEQGEEGTFTVKRVAEEMGDWLGTWVLIKYATILSITKTRFLISGEKN